MGRPPVQINWDEFFNLVSYQCTQIEIAHFFDVSVDALDNACRRDLGQSLAEVWDKKRHLGKVRLRKIQFEIAESKSPAAAAMAIFLGKQKSLLGQTDRPEPDPIFSPDHDRTYIFEQFCVNAGYFKPFEKQVEMMQFGITDGEVRLLLGSRGYGKTDYVTSQGTAYDVYMASKLGLQTSNLIITKSKTRNTAIIEEIAESLKKNGVELEKENASCIRVKGHTGKDHSVEVLTIKSSFRGRHPKRIIFDDPVTEEDVSEAMRILVKRKYNEAMKLCSNICIIGQPADPFDLYSELRDKIRTLEIPHGTMPQLDADIVAMEAAGVDRNSIEMSYHLRIPKSGATIFENLRFLDKYPAGDSVAFIDPSDGGDYTAWTMAKSYGEGVAFVGNCLKRAWYHCLDEIVEDFKKRGVRRVCFETNKHGDQPVLQLRDLFRKLGLNIGVVGKPSDSNKHAAIKAAGSFSHLLHLSKESSQVYTDQVVKYSHESKFDDAPDSLARLLEWIGLIKGRK